MKILLGLFIFASLFVCCENKQICEGEDPLLREKFQNSFDSLERYLYIEKHNLDETIPIYNMRDILSYFIIVTGIDDWEVFDLEHPLPPGKNPKKLIRKWKQWYEDNKCNITFKKADSIYFEQSEIYDIAYEVFYETSIKREIHSNEVDSIMKMITDSLRQEYRKNYYK